MEQLSGVDLQQGSERRRDGDVTALAYDTSARPSSTTSPYGAVTNYYNNDSANPPTRLAVTDTHGTRSTLDGFGRTIRTETGTWANNTFTPVSAVDTQYVTCACTALGKVWRVSQPYASGGSAQNWTTYTYDGLGRTTKVVSADGQTATTYSYSNNTVAVTDPAGSSDRISPGRSVSGVPKKGLRTHR